MSTLTIAGHGSCTAIVGGTNTLNVPTYVPAVGDMVLVRCNQTVTATGTGAFFDFYVNAAGTVSGGFYYLGLGYTPSGVTLLFYKVLTASDIAAMGATAGALTLGITNVGGTTTAVGTAAAIVVSGFTGIAGATFDIAQQGANMTTSAATVSMTIPQFQTTYSNLVASGAEAVLIAGVWNGTWATGSGNLPTGTINGATATFFDDLSASTPRTSVWGWATAAPNVGGGNTIVVNWTTATRKAGFFVISVYDSNNVAGTLNGAAISLSASATPSAFSTAALELAAGTLAGLGNLTGSASAFMSLVGGGPGPGAVGTQGYTGSASASISLSASARPLLYTDYNAVPGRATIPFRPAAPLEGNLVTAAGSISLTAAAAVTATTASGAITLALAGPPATTTASGALVLSGTASPISTASPATIVLTGYLWVQGGHGALTLAAAGPAPTLPIASDLELLATAVPYNVAPGSISLSAAGPSPSASATGDLELVTHSTAAPLPATIVLTAQPLGGLDNPSAATLTLAGSTTASQANAVGRMTLTATGPVATATASGDLELTALPTGLTFPAASVTLNAVMRATAFAIVPIATTFVAPSRAPAFAAWPAS